MALKTKSIKAPVDIREDGIRIGIFGEYDFEKYKDYPLNANWSELAPSEELMKSRNSISWGDYVDRFNKEVIIKAGKKIENLAKLAMEKDVTVLDGEDSPEYSNRRLLALECQKYASQKHATNLEVIIN